jgi:hypothetical protein
VDGRTAPQAGTPASMRALNQRLVLDRLREHGEATRPEIASKTGLSKPTVGQAGSTNMDLNLPTAAACG